MKSMLERKLTYKALGFLHRTDYFTDLAFENSSLETQAQFKIKNVCAALQGDLVQRLEDTLALLGMTKREFLESAIIEALDKADLIMMECGVTDYLDDLAERQAKEREVA
jgi:hypothetical protein